MKKIFIPIMKFFGSKTILKKFTIPFLLQFTVSIVLVGWLLLQGSEGASLKVLSELKKQSVYQVSEQLELHMSEALSLNQVNYSAYMTDVLNLYSTTEREQYFLNHLKTYPYVSSMFIGLEDRTFYGARKIETESYQMIRNSYYATGGDSWFYSVDMNGNTTEVVERIKNYDAREQSWYIRAKDSGGPVFSEIYSHEILHEPSVTVSYPFYHNGKVLGVTGIDYSLTWLKEVLGELSIGESGIVFVTDQRGYLVADSMDGSYFSSVDRGQAYVTVDQVEQPLIEVALNNSKSNSELVRFRYSGSKYYVSQSVVQQQGMSWNIYVVLAEDDFLSSMKSATFKTVMVAVFSLIFFFIFSLWIAKRVIKPIERINQAANELTRGRLMTVPDDDREDELGELSRSFNIMARRLTTLVANLEDVVEMRTIELQERNLELEQLTYVDGLTGIYNRRKFNDALESAWQLALRQNMPLALMIIDIDFFKSYNDTYGHQAGDDCLRTIGSLLNQKAKRLSDLAARYGGEEFVLIIQSPKSAEKVLAFANDIRASLEELQIENKASTFKIVTMSIGVAFVTPSFNIKIDDFITMADKALYKAKDDGRNRVCICTDEK